MERALRAREREQLARITAAKARRKRERKDLKKKVEALRATQKAGLPDETNKLYSLPLSLKWPRSRPFQASLEELFTHLFSQTTEPNWMDIYKAQHEEFLLKIDSIGWGEYYPQWQTQYALIERGLSRAEDLISIAIEGLNGVITKKELKECNARVDISRRVRARIMMLECSASHFEILMKEGGTQAYRRAYIHNELVWQQSNIQ